MSTNCKYQRIIRDGEVVQPGDIDTQVKFVSLVSGIDLQGKTVLDVGCNCGEMCRMAKESGARYVHGIDTNREYVHQAREFNPNLGFSVRRAERATGNYDVVIASAVFHYIRDHDAFLAQMARVVGEVLTMDVWVDADGGRPGLFLTQRGLFIPNDAAFRAITKKWFGVVQEKGLAPSPDHSQRVVYHLREPKLATPKAVLVYGKSGLGKTTYARELLGHEHLQLDLVFIEWRKTEEQSKDLSVSNLVDDLWFGRRWGERTKYVQDYLSFHRNYLKRWLAARVNLDVVIEGYDLVYPKYREMVRGLLGGWQVEEVEL